MEKSQYKLLNIILVRSVFERTSQIDFNSNDFKSEIGIDVDSKTSEGGRLLTTVKLNFIAGTPAQKQIQSEIIMLGEFEYPKKSELKVDEFAKINAPAIIFPFIREHLASLTSKAGMKPILLPPLNFVKLANLTTEKEKE